MLLELDRLGWFVFASETVPEVEQANQTEPALFDFSG